jgi:hypothetical protein
MNRMAQPIKFRRQNTSEPLLSVRDLSVAFHQGGDSQMAVDRISFDIKRGETVALVGESGLREIGFGAVSAQIAALPGSEPSERRNPLQGRGPALGARSCDPRRAWQCHHHDLPGADDVAQSASDSGKTDLRDSASASADQCRRSAKTGSRTARPGRHSRSAAAASQLLSAPAVGRAAAACDDRHGARQPA